MPEIADTAKTMDTMEPTDTPKVADTSEVETPVFDLIESTRAIVPVSENKALERFKKEEFARRKIIHPGMKDIEVLNSFRELRTSILQKLARFNSILQISTVTSGGGASFSAINLAVSCTFNQHRYALLVDCNFEDSSLADTLDVKFNAGLCDYLTDKVSSVSEIIYPTRIPRLSLVPAGVLQSKDSVEFFTGENMRLFLDDIRYRYRDRIIIVDAPPVLESADAKILAEITDHTLLVLPYKGVNASKVNRMIKAIGKEKIVGMMLNN